MNKALRLATAIPHSAAIRQHHAASHFSRAVAFLNCRKLS